MTEQPDVGGDLSYDEAHDAAATRSPEPARRDEAGPPAAGPTDPPAELSGDYSYDLAHDVPPG